MAGVVHYLGPVLLPLCPDPPPGGYSATPVPEDVTCEACRTILAEHA